MTEPLAYLNGQMVPASEARLPVYDAGVVQGAAVAEQCRTFRLELFGLERHIDRLFGALDFMGLKIDLTRDDLAKISRELVAHNGKLLQPGQELGLIQFVTAGPYPSYLSMAKDSIERVPTVCVHTFRLPFELWADKRQAGTRVVIPKTRHVPPTCGYPSIKHRSRLHFFLAQQEAARQDPGANALLLDTDGYVTETNAANFLIVKDGTIVSPSVRNILPGISRGVVFELAAKLGIPTAERDLRVSDVMAAEEAFLTSTPYCLMPVCWIDGKPIGDGKPGPIFQRVVDAWSQLVGVDILREIVEGALRA